MTEERKRNHRRGEAGVTGRQNMKDKRGIARGNDRGGRRMTHQKEEGNDKGERGMGKERAGMTLLPRLFGREEVREKIVL